MNLSFSPISLILAIFAFAIISIVYLIPKIIKLGYQLDITDTPNKRKQHTNPIVRLGGFAMVISFFLSFGIAWILGGFELMDFSQSKIFFVATFGAFCYFLIGLADDIWNISPWPRLGLQVLVAITLWTQNIRINSFDVSWLSSQNSIIYLDDHFSLILSVIWLVGLTNAINWIDGLDGLAGGVSAISSAALTVIGLYLNKPEIFFYSAALTGVCIGFLKYNLKPNTILMGDGGSYFIGISLGQLALLTNSQSNNHSNFMICLLIFLIPIIDMIIVIFSRLIDGKSPFYPDRNHFHHRLMRFGFRQRDTVLLAYFSTAIFSSFALMLSGINDNYIYLAIISLSFAFVSILYNNKKTI